MGEAALLGRGSAKGRLFDLGAFPGAVATTDGSSHFRGELYRLPSAETAFRALDAYEGCGSASPGPHRFVREVAEVQLDGGGIARAWVYWYTGSLAGARRIHSGDYVRPGRS